MRKYISAKRIEGFGITLNRVQVFSKHQNRGNPAAVVTGFQGDDIKMQTLATKLDLPATVFVLQSESEDCSSKLRFFSPTSELPMCGHGALAASIAVVDGSEKVAIQTVQKKIHLSMREDGLAQMMLQKDDKPNYDIHVKEICELLRLKSSFSINKDLPSCIASVGVPIVLVALKSRSDLFSLQPDSEGILAWTKQNNLGGIYAYTADTIYKDSTFHARCFNPRFNKNFEDVATGAAAGALAFAYSEAKKVAGDIIIEQGTYLNKESQIFVSVDPHDSEIKLGGFLTIHNEALKNNDEDINTSTRNFEI